MTFLEFTEGPLWTVAATVFVAGALWRLVGILRFGRKRDLSVPRASGMVGALRALFLHFIPHGGFWRRTKFHVVAGYAFHLGLFALVVFAAPHILFLKENVTGVGWTALPNWGFAVAAQVAFFGLILLWVRRVTDAKLRLISDRDDYIGSTLTFLVMLTGCMALGESHEILRALHMLVVDVWLIYFPFSRLMHGFTFVLSRGYMGAIFGRRGVTP